DVIISKKIERDRVTVFISPNSLGDKKRVTPTYILSKGSRITEGLENLDYSRPHHIKVVSEDGIWSKNYLVRFLDMDLPTKYFYEDWQSNKGNYDDCYEKVIIDNNGTEDNLYMWSSGNMGYRIVKPSSKPMEYPTYKTLSSADAHSGRYAACMATRYIGPGGQGSPIAAGSLFIGEFSGKGINIMKEQRRATRFGFPFSKKPKKLKFWFKYETFEEMYQYDNEGNKIGKYADPVTNDTRDFCAVYAVMFDNKEAARLYNGETYLNGNTILSSPAEVGRAILTDNDKYGTKAKYGNQYVYKELEFTYSKAIDPEKLNNYDYSIAIIFSSSYYGAYFIGGLGSHLWIDDVELECE
ncbi:MAG: PCMD domain-containing protein, partial [Bacteroidales bacterium]